MPIIYDGKRQSRMIIPTSGPAKKLRKNHCFGQESPGNRWKTEAVLRAGRSPNYPGDFRPFPITKRIGIWPKDNGEIRKIASQEYCFHEIAGIPPKRPFPYRTVRPANSLH
jgi:hypothetical protein